MTYLGERNVHERKVVHDGTSNTNNANDTAPTHGKGSSAHTALDTSALEHGGRREVLVSVGAKKLADLAGVAFGIELRVDLVSDGGGDELLGESKALGLDIGNDDGMRARSTSSSQRNETNGAGAADENAAAEAEAAGLDAVEDDAEGLKEGGFLEGDGVGDLEEPLGGVDLVALQGAVVGVNTGELDVLAQVVAALLAEEALVAGHTGFDGDAVADLKVGDALAGLEDDAGGFVAEDAVAADDEGADAAGFPEVDVGAIYLQVSIWL